MKVFISDLIRAITQVKTGPHGIKMVWCPPGKFIMGEGVDCHEVTLTKGFWIGKCQVTQKQWKAVMGNNPSHFKGEENPVERVSWDDAQEFIAKIGNGYRLPTEAEWEYACRAGSTTGWCFGDDEALLSDYAWFGDNSDRKTHPVGQKKPNAWGIHDMHGNVDEWCQDLLGCYPKGPATDPKGPAPGTNLIYFQYARMFRGGSWISSASWCRSACRRDRVEPDDRHGILGFRLARN